MPGKSFIMRRSVFFCAAICAPLIAGCRSPQQSVDSHRQETAAIAADFMHLQYDEKNIAAAKAKYYAADFIQHNPEIANGQLGDQQFIAARGQRDPAHYLPVEQWVNKVDHVMVDDRLFAVHHRLYTSPQDSGRVFVDIFRVENGRMVEHWDIIQPIPAEAKNDNSMTSDLMPGMDPAPGDPKPEAVIREYLRIGLVEHDAVKAAETYIADNFRQHSPHIPDGKAALIDYFKSKPKNPGPPRSESVSHIVSDRDLVLVTRHSNFGPDSRGSMYADLFRIARGKIVEHWDVIQPVPEKSVNGNTMW